MSRKFAEGSFFSNKNFFYVMERTYSSVVVALINQAGMLLEKCENFVDLSIK